MDAYDADKIQLRDSFLKSSQPYLRLAISGCPSSLLDEMNGIFDGLEELNAGPDWNRIR